MCKGPNTCVLCLFAGQGPALKKLCEQLAKELGSDTETITRRLEGLHECNPMMGLRGCRLGTVHPEITAMQVGAAAAAVGVEGVQYQPAWAA
jgi:pyruvate,orthophosphate dikinase